MSLLQGVFPKDMKIANVIPIFKNDDCYVFTNYRPVSVLTSMSKIFERVFYNRLLKFINNNNILYIFQFGFKKCHSTFMALVILMEKITSALEKGEYVLGIFLDFSKAFDTVNHEILFKKLDFYGVRGTANNWIRDYLSNRTQFVTFNGVSSSQKIIKCGVPQGSILGPLLFLIYVNDLAFVSEKLFMVLFADDTNAFLSGHDLKELESTLNDELQKIETWLRANKLSLNIKKTHFIIFKPKKKKNNHNVNIKINNESIAEVKQTKFLGVILDSALTWKPHINYIANKMAKCTGLIRKSRHILKKDSLITLYYTFLYPYMTYCIQVWGGTYTNSLLPVIKTQKTAIRNIFGLSKYTESTPLFKDLNLLKFHEVYCYVLNIFMFKHLTGKLPNVFQNFFVTNSSVHPYDTRHKNQYRIPIYHTTAGQMTFKYQAVKYWNKYGHDIFESNNNITFNSFKKCLRSKLLKKYD